jgi:N-acetylglucosamine kinase-like BadF-type ATPase
MCKYFNVSSQMDMLPHFYSNFAKENFAGFAKCVAEGAQQGDALSLHVVADAGSHLGRHVAAILPKLTAGASQLQIVCVGSVFHSWAFLKKSFLAPIHASPHRPSRLRLVRLEATAAIGAASLAARSINQQPVIHYDKNGSLLYDSASEASA